MLLPFYTVRLIKNDFKFVCNQIICTKQFAVSLLPVQQPCTIISNFSVLIPKQLEAKKDIHHSSVTLHGLLCTGANSYASATFKPS